MEEQDIKWLAWTDDKGKVTHVITDTVEIKEFLEHVIILNLEKYESRMERLL